MKKNLKSLSFNYDLGGLAAYTDALNSDIISEAVLTPATMEYVNVIPGIKGTQNVNLLSETLDVQTGINCGWTGTGQQTFTVAAVTVQSFKVNTELCLQQLNTLWLGQYLNPGSYNENAPFEQAIIDLQTKQIKRYNEDLLWNATTAGTVNTFSGYKQLIVNQANTSTGNVKKVNFGHGGTSAKKLGQKTMSIKKSNPARRKSFRARHNCATPGPKTSARYWSCRKW